ncbi:hypothetical protein GCM10020256_22410 [Streptomyces thermocoprophilus]
MDHRAGDDVEDQVGCAGGVGGVGLLGEFAAGLGAGAALDHEAFLPFDDGFADAFPQRLVAGGLRDDRHQPAARLRAGEDRRELEDHALDVGGEAAPVGQPQFVEEFGDRVDDEFVLAGPAAVQGRLRHSGPGRHVSEGELGPAQLDQCRPGGGEDRGVRGGAARAPGTSGGGGAALHASTITAPRVSGCRRAGVREITGARGRAGCRRGTGCHYATGRSESPDQASAAARRDVHERRPPARVGTRCRQVHSGDADLAALFAYARERGRIDACSHGTCP